jgi:hypothetical protein
MSNARVLLRGHVNKARLLCLLVLPVILAAAAGNTSAPAHRTGGSAQPAPARVVESYSGLPLAFEANSGQTDPQVKFLSRGAGYTLSLTSNEAVLTLAQFRGKRQAHQLQHPCSSKIGLRSKRHGACFA